MNLHTTVKKIAHNDRNNPPLYLTTHTSKKIMGPRKAVDRKWQGEMFLSPSTIQEYLCRSSNFIMTLQVYDLFILCNQIYTTAAQPLSTRVSPPMQRRAHCAHTHTHACYLLTVAQDEPNLRCGEEPKLNCKINISLENCMTICRQFKDLNAIYSELYVSIPTTILPKDITMAD